MSSLYSTMMRDLETILRIVWKGLGGDHVEWETIIQSLNIFLGKGSASASGSDHQNNRPTLSVAITTDYDTTDTTPQCDNKTLSPHHDMCAYVPYL